jgi:hypothetical protein
VRWEKTAFILHDRKPSLVLNHSVMHLLCYLPLLCDRPRRSYYHDSRQNAERSHCRSRTSQHSLRGHRRARRGGRDRPISQGPFERSTGPFRERVGEACNNGHNAPSAIIAERENRSPQMGFSTSNISTGRVDVERRMPSVSQYMNHLGMFALCRLTHDGDYDPCDLGSVSKLYSPIECVIRFNDSFQR